MDMDTDGKEEGSQKVPQRSLRAGNKNLPEKLSIVGLGCSSFSSFFGEDPLTVENLKQDDPLVQEWIETVRYAVVEAGITLLDTAPWYGHGTSEVVVGWALRNLFETHGVDRQSLTINTKIGRYEAEPPRQFDFSREKTIQSVKTSLQRLGLDNVDVLQLHDPEFSPTLDILLEETIPAMITCREQGLCRALGMTGYPLQVQHQIMQATLQRFPNSIRVWDQALTYGHYNLHDCTIFTGQLPSSSTTGSSSSLSFATYCEQQGIELLAAAPLTLGLLTPAKLPKWHPASPTLQEACRNALNICTRNNVSIVHIAILAALAHPDIPCTLIGMKNVEQVKAAQELALRFSDLIITDHQGKQQQLVSDILQQVMTAEEHRVYLQLVDTDNGPFAQIWADGSSFQWDGVLEAWKFWERLPNMVSQKWQTIA